jgi:hypothetical protein
VLRAGYLFFGAPSVEWRVVVGKSWEKRLGAVKDVALAKVRDLAAAARILLKQGVDSLDAPPVLMPPKIPTFGSFADDAAVRVLPVWVAISITCCHRIRSCNADIIRRCLGRMYRMSSPVARYRQ